MSANGDAARCDMRAGRIERCLAADMTVKERYAFNKVAESSLCKRMVRFREEDSDRFPAGRARCRAGRGSRVTAPGGGVASSFSAPDTGEQGTEVRFSRCCGLRPHRRWRLLRPCPRSRPRDFWAVSQEMGADFAMSLDFCAVFGGGCSLPAQPTWGNAGAARRFGPIRPAKPPRSCKRGSRVARGARRHCGG